MPNIFRFIKCLYSHIGRNNGSTLVLVSAFMVLLMGVAAISIDVGQLYKARREMVTSADAAAIAGALELAKTKDQSQAEKMAIHYAVNNKAQQCSEDDVDFINDLYNGENVTIVSVTAKRKVDYTFAKVLGFNDKWVEAKAKALWLYPIGYKGNIIPIFYELDETDDLDDNTPINLPYGEQQFLVAGGDTGNWGLLKVDAEGIQSNAIPAVNAAFSGVPAVIPDVDGNSLEYIDTSTQTGATPNPRITAIHNRMINEDVEMYGIIPIIQPFDGAGQSTQATIVGFARFLIEDVVTDIVKEDDGLWYSKGNPAARDLEDGEEPHTYGNGVTANHQGDPLYGSYPLGTVIGKIITNRNVSPYYITVKSYLVTAGTQDEDNNGGVISVTLID